MSIAPNFFAHFSRMLAMNLGESFFKLRVLNRERLIEDGPAIIVANHQSFFDPPMIGHIFPNYIHFLARHSLWHPPGMNYAMNHCQCIPVNQTRPDPASIIKVLRVVRGGGRVLIFPEGSRSEDGDIHEAMPGIGLILSKLAGIPVQPIRIDGAFDCLPIGAKALKFMPITVSVGKPYYLSGESVNGRDRKAQRALGEKVMDSIRAINVDY